MTTDTLTRKVLFEKKLKNVLIKKYYEDVLSKTSGEYNYFLMEEFIQGLSENLKQYYFDEQEYQIYKLCQTQN